jgi:replicative DNA helicase
LNVAKQALPVLYFSLEEAQIKLRERLLCGLLRKRLADVTLEELDEGITALRSLPIYFDDVSADIRQIESSAKEAKALRGIRLIFVDYAQIVRVKMEKGANREQTVAEVSRSLRLLAMELATPVVVLSQLNKEGSTRESMSLEQDCTACWQIKPDEDERGKGWIEVPYQRFGPGNIKFSVTFLGDIGRIENYQAE